MPRSNDAHLVHRRKLELTIAECRLEIFVKRATRLLKAADHKLNRLVDVRARLRQRVGEARLTGVDVAEKLVEVALLSARVGHERLHNRELMLGDVVDGLERVCRRLVLVD